MNLIKIIIENICILYIQKKTYKSDYSSTWDEEYVTIEQLQDYIKKGYAIKINC